MSAKYERIATTELFDNVAKRVAVQQAHLAAASLQWQSFLATLSAHRQLLDARPEVEDQMRPLLIHMLERFDREEIRGMDLPTWLQTLTEGKLPPEPSSAELHFPPEQEGK